MCVCVKTSVAEHQVISRYILSIYLCTYASVSHVRLHTCNMCIESARMCNWRFSGWWLFEPTPLKKDGLRQLGWWIATQYFWETAKFMAASHHQAVFETCVCPWGSSQEAINRPCHGETDWETEVIFWESKIRVNPNGAQWCWNAYSFTFTIDCTFRKTGVHVGSHFLLASIKT